MFRETFLLVFMFILILIFPVKTYSKSSKSYMTKKCNIYYIKATKNKAENSFYINEAIIWGKFAIKKNPNSLSAYMCLANVYSELLNLYTINNKSISDKMFNYIETIDDKAEMLSHERIKEKEKENQSLKTKIIEGEKILQYKRNESPLMKIRDKINYLYQLIIKYEGLIFKDFLNNIIYFALGGILMRNKNFKN